MSRKMLDPVVYNGLTRSQVDRIKQNCLAWHYDKHAGKFCYLCKLDGHCWPELHGKEKQS